MVAKENLIAYHAALTIELSMVLKSVFSLPRSHSRCVQASQTEIIMAISDTFSTVVAVSHVLTDHNRFRSLTPSLSSDQSIDFLIYDAMWEVF